MKPIKISGEEFASICHIGTPKGPLVIDVMMNTLTPAEARRLAAWLLKAADYVGQKNRRGRKHDVLVPVDYTVTGAVITSGVK